MRKTLLAMSLLLVPFAAQASYERLIFEDNFTEAADALLNAHTPDYTYFGGAYYETGGGSYDCKISGSADAVISGNVASPSLTNYFTLGSYTNPVKYDYTFKLGYYTTSIFMAFRKNTGTYGSGDLNCLAVFFYYSSGTTMTLTLYSVSGSSFTSLGTTSVSGFTTSKIWNAIIEDTGTNVKVYCNSVAGEDNLGEATTLYLDIDTALYAGNTNHGYRCSSSSLSYAKYLYHLKVYDSLVSTATPTISPTATRTPTPEASATCTVSPTPSVSPTVTATPDPQRKKFIYDNSRRDLKYDNDRRNLIYDSERRTLKKR